MTPAIARTRAALASLALALAGLLALAGCSSSDGGPTAPPPPAASQLGLYCGPDSASAAVQDSFANAVLFGLGSGMTVFPLSPLWTELEPDSGIYQTSELPGLFQLLPAVGLEAYINLRIIDTNQRNQPAYLPPDIAFDDPRYVARVDALVDTLIRYLDDDDVIAFSLGNEVDAYFGNPSHQAELPAFRALVQRQIQRIKARLPGLRIGVCTISPTYSAGSAFVGDTLNAYTDLAIYTYYAFQNSLPFQHVPPAQLPADFATLKARAAGKPWALQEVGYSSSPLNGSDEAKQAEFVTRFRDYMRASQQSDLVFGAYFLQTDFTQTLVDSLAGYYGLATPEFKAYLKNLGLRRSDGTVKPSWYAWRGVTPPPPAPVAARPGAPDADARGAGRARGTRAPSGAGGAPEAAGVRGSRAR